MHRGAALSQRVARVAGRERTSVGVHQLQPSPGPGGALPSRQEYPFLYAELKVAFPYDDFPLNPNILMATVIKLSLEVTSANIADSYSISLASADCLKNFANDIGRAYLPALGERNENLRGLMTGIKKAIANEEDLVCVG